jgi:hypothetical protein
MGGRRHFFPHGMTTRSSPARPGNGFGRTTRPGPDPVRASRLLKIEERVGDPRRH